MKKVVKYINKPILESYGLSILLKVSVDCSLYILYTSWHLETKMLFKISITIVYTIVIQQKIYQTTYNII